MVEYYLRKTSGTATYFQYIFILQVFFIPAGNGKHTPVAQLHIFLCLVYLRSGKFIPLISEILSVVIIFHQAVGTVLVWKNNAAVFGKAVTLFCQWFLGKGIY